MSEFIRELETLRSAVVEWPPALQEAFLSTIDLVQSKLKTAVTEEDELLCLLAAEGLMRRYLDIADDIHTIEREEHWLRRSTFKLVKGGKLDE